MLSTADSEPALCDQVEKRSYQIIHQNDRRIRFYIPGLGYEMEYANHLQEIILALHFVTEVHLNLHAHSLAVL